MSTEEELKLLYEEMYQAMIQKDLKKLNDLLDDEFVLIHMTGMRQSKMQFIEAVKNGTLNYYAEETEDIFVRSKENHAEIIGKSRVDAAVFGGGRYTWNLQQNLAALRSNNGWKFIRSQASTY